MGPDIKTDEDLLQYNKNIQRKTDPTNKLLKVETEGKSCILCGEPFKAVGNTRICEYCHQDSTAQYLYNENKRKPRPKNRFGTMDCTILGENKKTGKYDVEYISNLPKGRLSLIVPDMDIHREKYNLLYYLNDMISRNKIYLKPGKRKWPIYLKTCTCGCNAPFLSINNSHMIKPSCYEEKERLRLNKLHKINKNLKLMTQKEREKYGNLVGYGPPGAKGTITCSITRKESDEEEYKDIQRMKKDIG